MNFSASAHRRLAELRCIYGPKVADPVASKWLNHRVEVTGRAGCTRLMKVASLKLADAPYEVQQQVEFNFLTKILKNFRVCPCICPTPFCYNSAAMIRNSLRTPWFFPVLVTVIHKGVARAVGLPRTRQGIHSLKVARPFARMAALTEEFRRPLAGVRSDGSDQRNFPASAEYCPPCAKTYRLHPLAVDWDQQNR